jgi:hypothetical protein
VPEDGRAGFEEEFCQWIRLMSLDAACRLSSLSPSKQEKLLAAYQEYKDPGKVFRDISACKRVRGLAGSRISSFIIVETDCISFFPSAVGPFSGALDYAVAMNRRLFCDKKWYPIISFSSGYISQSSDRLLAYALEHEFEMSQIYKEIVSPGRLISHDQKREIMLSADEASGEKMSITPDELREDERLMNHLALTSPLLPKPYCELSLLHYLKANLPRLENYGIVSSSPEEEAFGEELAEEFRSWEKFTIETYDLFVREIVAQLRDANRGYA